MKKTKKIKLEDLKIQSFSTSQQLSKDQTNKIVGGDYTHEGSCLQTCESECCWYTRACYTDPTPYGPCGG